MALRYIAPLVAALALVACGGGAVRPSTADARIDRFDAPAAWKLIVRQVDVGQRPAGSPQLRKLAVVLRDRMPRGRFEAIPGEPGLRNIVATLPGRRPALVIGAHYDTLVEPEGFVGANNGAAGSAIVVKLARAPARRERPASAPELRFVLFDGEEPAAGLPEDDPDFYNHGLRGSRAYVAAHRKQVGQMVLLDYVAGKNLRLPRESSSSLGLWSRIRKAAKATGNGRYFPDRVGLEIMDDHTPFLRAGLEAVDMIDWDYPGHSLEDGIDKLSQRSVDAVGETLMQLLLTSR